MLNRRQIITGAAVMAGTMGIAPRALALAADPLGAILAETGGRLGLAAIDTGTGQRLMLDAGARYPMCSTFKWILAAAVLQRVDRGELDLAKMVRFSEADLLDYAPVVKANLAAGALSVEQLCTAAVELSDNSAANLLLPQVGGPQGVTRFIRAGGDQVTRLDRYEPELNIFKPDDPRDTTLPYAMALLMQRVLTDDVLTEESRDKLIAWMVASTTGTKRLRAGLPGDWRVGDKTGTSGAGQFNDVAIAFPPGRKPILIAAYLDAPATLDAAKGDAALAKVGALVGAIFARG